MASGMIPTTAELVARQVRLIVSPPTSTIFESRAILAELQSRFGPVAAFSNDRHDAVLRKMLRAPSAGTTRNADDGKTANITTSPTPAATAAGGAAGESQTMLALFEFPTSKQSSLRSSSLTVSCGGDLVPSAKDLDPFDARCMRGRHHPPKRTFACQIADEGDESTVLRRLAEENPYNGSFRVDSLRISYGNLRRCGAPLREMADIMHTEKVPSQVVAPRKSYHEGLMDAWRKGMDKTHELDQE